ncbi:MAG: 2-amino-4-hydroxy-6-hydroxymethyldihydropteridine diphosphokinase [Roseovarius sp.]|nr:2-amino-4-hydroxy-6-hydroxymethyldihydropteridine diphosphokinase [Roseovarius sp.]
MKSAKLNKYAKSKANCISECLIALGGNMDSHAGAPENTLKAALNRLGDLNVRVHAVSAFYRTPCHPAGAGPDYVNAAARLGCNGTPHDVLELLHKVEDEFGRKRLQRWGSRVLDLDLVAAENAILPDVDTLERWCNMPREEQLVSVPASLILPHPRMQDRPFVLLPLAEVAEGWSHPLTGKTAAQMLSDLGEEARLGITLV